MQVKSLTYILNDKTVCALRKASEIIQNKFLVIVCLLLNDVSVSSVQGRTVVFFLKKKVFLLLKYCLEISTHQVPF